MFLCVNYKNFVLYEIVVLNTLKKHTFQQEKNYLNVGKVI